MGPISSFRGKLHSDFAKIVLMVWVFTLWGCSDEKKSEEHEPLQLDSSETEQQDIPFSVPATFARYNVEEFFSSTTLFGKSFSEDGSAVLLTTDESGIFNVYRQSVDGPERTPLTQSNSNTMRGVSFFPDDDRVLIMVDSEGDERYHLYVRESGGSMTDLTPGTRLRSEFVAWSATGEYFFVKSNERDSRYFDLYRYASENYQRKMVFRNENAWALSSVSPDGRWLALRKINDNYDSDIYLFDMMSETSEPKIITAHMGKAHYIPYEFTPDSQQLIFGTDAQGDFVEAWVHGIFDKQRRKLAGDDWDVIDVAYSREGRYLFIYTNEDATRKVRIVESSSGEELTIPNLPEGNVKRVEYSSKSDKFALYIDADDSPTNLFVYAMNQGEPDQLTESLDRSILRDNLVVSEKVSFSSFDGLEIPALLYRPHTANSRTPAPAVVYIHGGPGGQSRTGYRPELQHLVNQGYVILAVNNRGSSGYGKVFYHLDDRKHGQDDLKDIVYAKKYLQSLEWVAKDRIGVMGAGYGGYLTMAALAFTDEFRMGINIYGVTNWVRTLKQIPLWWESNKKRLYQELGDPVEDESRLRQISPLFHTEDISSPVLVVQGARDPRVHQVESDEIVTSLRERDIPVEYVLFEDEGHGLLKKINRMKAQTAYLKFLERYL